MESTTQFPKTFFITEGLQNQTEALASVSPAVEGSDVCFINPQLAFIVVASSGSLMLVLLIAVLVLAYKLITLKRQRKARRPTHSNVDLRGSGHWSSERAEQGIVGPCETNLLLEEVQTDGDDAMGEEEEEKEAMLHQSNTKNKDEENVLATMKSSTSRDSCLDPAKEQEDMPLVV